MKLRKYLKENEITQKDFCEKCGISIPTLYRIYRGSEIYLSIAVKIERATKGLVSLSDLMPTKLRSKVVSLNAKKEPLNVTSKVLTKFN